MTRPLPHLGMAAVGAVHEIRSPLCTMAVLVEEMLARAGARAGLARDLKSLSAQIDACRRLVARLSEPPRAQAVDIWIEDTAAQWRRLHPGARLAARLRGPLPAPRLRAGAGIEHALLALLDNAAEASRMPVELQADWNRTRLVLRVLDRGPGIAPGVARVLGRKNATTKGGNGRGIGLIVAASAIRQARGRLKINNRPGGGACAMLVLPLRAVATPRHQKRRFVN